MGGGGDRRRAAADEVLDRLAPDTGRGLATEVIRDGAALLVRRGSVLVRVRHGRWRETAEREVVLAGLLADLHVPVTGLVEPDGQPWTVDAMVVTAWRWVAAGQRVTAGDVGLLARTLRERTAVAAGAVVAFDPFEAIRSAVAEMDDDADARFVRDRADALEPDWRRASGADPLGRAVVHGDLHRGNVVAGSSGILMTDLELIGRGPASYDAVPTVLAVDRYGVDPATLHDFFAAFGADPRSWDGFAVFQRVYELWVTAWAVGTRDAGPGRADEARRRVETLRDGADHRWRLL